MISILPLIIIYSAIFIHVIQQRCDFKKAHYIHTALILIASMVFIYDIYLDKHFIFKSTLIQIHTNYIGIFLALSSSILTIIAIILNPNYSIGLLTSLYGIYKITSTTDFFNMYVGYEVILAGFIYSLVKSGFVEWKKYLKYQMLASFLIFFGVACFYLEQGHLGIFHNVQNSFNANVMLLGFLMKSSVYPLGLWIKLYKNISNKVLFWAGGLITKIPIYSIIVLMPWLSNVLIIHIFGMFSAIIGALLAYKSKTEKEILSFHIMSQVGIILMIASFESLNNMNYGLTILYITHHIWTKSTLFAMSQNKKSLICKYAALSLIGVPITPGFIAKLTFLYFLITKQFYISAMVLIISNIITAISMEKFMNIEYIEEQNNLKSILFYLSLLVHIILMCWVFKVFSISFIYISAF